MILTSDCLVLAGLKISSWLMRQKVVSQNGCFKKSKYAKISEKWAFLTPWYACANQGVRNVRFLENLPCFVFLKYPFYDSPFCLITDKFKDLITSFCLFAHTQHVHLLTCQLLIISVFKRFTEDVLLIESGTWFHSWMACNSRYHNHFLSLWL